MSRLTKAETAWLAELQAVLDRCPSKRLGFFTTGDSTVRVYDASKEAKINAAQDANDNMDFCNAVIEAKAELDSAALDFPAPVHSTSG